jgi:4-hydroxythreonine-4-phosphate dehydrogenase
VDKATMQEHNSGFTGHTELLAEAFNVPDNLMMMVSEELKLGLVTNHLPIS